MANIVISGYYGFGNAGDEAMLTAILASFRRLQPDAEFTVISGNPAETQARHGVKSVYRLNGASIASAIAACDLVVSGGGSLLQTVTSGRSLFYYLSIMQFAKLLGKRVMIYAQGVGPVQGTTARGAVRRVLNQIDLITVRDRGSLEELKELGVYKPPCQVTADPVLSLLPANKEFGRQLLTAAGLTATPLIGFCVREWQDLEYYKQVLAIVADRLVAQGAQVVFIPMQQPDIAAAQRIAAQMHSPATVLTADYQIEQLLSIIGNLDMLIAVRLHALIFAAVMDIPLVGISYDPKVERFLASIGKQTAGTVHELDPDTLWQQINAAWPHGGNTKPINDQVVNLRQQALLTAELALNLIR